VTALGPGDTFEQPKGTVRRYSVTLVDPESGEPLSGTFAGSEALRCYAWAGGDGPILASFPASWSTASPPVVFLDVQPQQLAGLEEMPYPVRLEVDRGGQWQDGADLWCSVLPEVATATPPVAYGSYADLIKFGGTAVRQLLTIDSLAGFLEERGQAWSYLRAAILARYRPPGGQRGGLGYAAGLPGYWTSIDYPNVVLAGYLDQGLLILTDQCREILARKALAIIFERQPDESWRKRARAEHVRADWLISSFVAGIDVNQDGYPDITVNCGVINARDI
jgi:hypothetical protein